jgi:hypothetical protein
VRRQPQARARARAGASARERPRLPCWAPVLPNIQNPGSASRLAPLSLTAPCPSLPAPAPPSSTSDAALPGHNITFVSHLNFRDMLEHLSTNSSIQAACQEPWGRRGRRRQTCASSAAATPAASGPATAALEQAEPALWDSRHGCGCVAGAAAASARQPCQRRCGGRPPPKTPALRGPYPPAARLTGRF